MSIINRLTESTPKFFRVLRNLGLILAAASATIISSSDILPPAIVKIAGYVAVAGSVMSAVSQTAVKSEEK